jgi:hypothetical protein
MYDEQATTMMGMTASDFNKLSDAKKTKVTLPVLDTPVFVTMFIKNEPPNMYSNFVIKTTLFDKPQ